MEVVIDGIPRRKEEMTQNESKTASEEMKEECAVCRIILSMRVEVKWNKIK